ncbi:MAG: cold-shock protein [Promethearchaeota archaeon]
MVKGTVIQGDENDFKVIYEGDIVEFNVVQGQKGPQASDLVVVEKGPRKSFRSRKQFF